MRTFDDLYKGTALPLDPYSLPEILDPNSRLAQMIEPAFHVIEPGWEPAPRRSGKNGQDAGQSSQDDSFWMRTFDDLYKGTALPLDPYSLPEILDPNSRLAQMIEPAFYVIVPGWEPAPRRSGPNGQAAGQSPQPGQEVSDKADQD